MAKPPERRQPRLLEVVDDQYLVLARLGDMVIGIRLNNEEGPLAAVAPGHYRRQAQASVVGCDRDVDHYTRRSSARIRRCDGRRS